MSLSDKKEEKKEIQAEKGSEGKQSASSVKAGKKSKKEKMAVTEKAELACKVLLEPIITEKSHDSAALNKYVFKVSKRSKKKQVKNSIESLYNVKVDKINVISVPSKKRVYGRSIGRKPGYKKAIVTLEKGNKIELFEGV